MVFLTFLQNSQENTSGFINFASLFISLFSVRDLTLITFVKKSTFLSLFLSVNTQLYILVLTLPPYTFTHKIIHCEKRKIKYISAFYLYLKED